ncbi:MAG TPA: hypothetical protein VMR25_06785 [Planctomycetaceae bacterium]|jgi:hypothetical protein|nr:hypothetical protein [Planctomycetaceae bacterium]
MRNLCSVKAAITCGLLAAGLLLAATARRAEARPIYYGIWRTTYPAVDKANNVNKLVKCNVCHVGTDKKKRNAYGKAIQDALGDKKNLKKGDKADIIAAFKKAEAADSETAGKTFGDLLKANELPSKAP